MKNLLEDVLQGKDLSEEQAHGLMRELAGGQMEPAQAGALLAALRVLKKRAFHSHLSSLMTVSGAPAFIGLGFCF